MMENLLLGVDDTASVVKYDLKGSRRNRYITGRKDGKVTLDNNFIFDMKSRPLPMQYQMKRMMQIAINNDSLYLAKHSIIDYSLFVAIDRDKKTVRVGLIDYVQHYTFKKVLESKVKQATSEIEPTIISPDAYKKRFRTAMDKYFIALVPDKNTDLQSIVEKILKR
jgi:1-phosphatidylinositol-3-phosphate 5-kinase